MRITLIINLNEISIAFAKASRKYTSPSARPTGTLPDDFATSETVDLDICHNRTTDDRVAEPMDA